MHNIRVPGSVENPIEPQDICNPQQVEDGDDSIKACVCTEDFCNGYMDKDEASQDKNNNAVFQVIAVDFFK